MSLTNNVVAGFLAVALVAGTGSLLTMTLYPAPQQNQVQTDQVQQVASAAPIEKVTVYAQKPAS